MEKLTEIFIEKLPRINYEVTFSNNQTLIICDKTYKQILEQMEDNQDLMLFTQDNSMINLNQIIKIIPLEEDKEDIILALSENGSEK